MMEYNKVLLLGNGINRLQRNYSWGDLLDDLITELNIENSIKFPDKKPFTLLFEEIVVKSKKHYGKSEVELKQKISDLVNNKKYFEPNEYHGDILNLDVQHILTTNYDYNFEKAYKKNYNGERANLLLETKYNLFRRRKIGNKYVWHIHGEADIPNTIVLGYEHYVGQLQKMRNYLTVGHPRKTKNGESRVKTKIFDKNDLSDCNVIINNVTHSRDAYSWIDLFLCYDVHIIGFSLDYTEIDLWWLIIYKEKLRQKHNQIGKTIYYYIDNEKNENKEAKLSLLESYGVEIKKHKVKDNNYGKVYKGIIRNI